MVFSSGSMLRRHPGVDYRILRQKGTRNARITQFEAINRRVPRFSKATACSTSGTGHGSGWRQRCWPLRSSPPAIEADLETSLTDIPDGQQERIRSCLDEIRRLMQQTIDALQWDFAGKTVTISLQRLGANTGAETLPGAEAGSVVMRLSRSICDWPVSRRRMVVAHELDHVRTMDDPAAGDGIRSRRALRAALDAATQAVDNPPPGRKAARSRCSTFHEAHLYNFNDATLEALAARAGFDRISTTPSADGGNLLAVFAPGEVRNVQRVLAGLRDNPRRIERGVLGHSAWQYWLSARPYRRLLQHCWRPVAERAALWRAVPARQRLDALYAAALQPPPAARPMPVWLFVASAYVLAVLAEETLLDFYLPRQGWSEQQGFWLFAGLLACTAAICWQVMRRSRSRQQLFRVGALTSPLFVLPIYC
jgi:hypothetical protein